MAGYDPTGAGFDGITYDADQLEIKADMYETNNTGNPDGDTDDSNEHIIYTMDSDYPFEIRRNTGGGRQEFALNIQSFIFEYLDSAGSSTTATADIRQIKITITARTSKADADYTDPTYGDHYRRYTLTSVITPRNLDF
jgi:hypothetical protein